MCRNYSFRFQFLKWVFMIGASTLSIIALLHSPWGIGYVVLLLVLCIYIKWG